MHDDVSGGLQVYNLSVDRSPAVSFSFPLSQHTDYDEYNRSTSTVCVVLCFRGFFLFYFSHCTPDSAAGKEIESFSNRVTGAPGS